MRAISIKQPYASLIASGKKRTERRTWRISPGPLLIVASKSPRVGELPCGVALAIVDVEHVVQTARGFSWVLTNVRPVVPLSVRGWAAVYHVPSRRIRLTRRCA
jgi:hypothetical protein